jgi:hypothetical protein
LPTNKLEYSLIGPFLYLLEGELPNMRDAIKFQIKPIEEMMETNLLKTLQIFWPHGNWGSQKRFYYDPNNKRRFYKVGCYSENMKMIWEYDDPDHYEDVWKIKRDRYGIGAVFKSYTSLYTSHLFLMVKRS